MEISKTIIDLIFKESMKKKAIEFPTQEAYDKYMKDHPDADPKNHRVVENPAKGLIDQVLSDNKENLDKKEKPTFESREDAEKRVKLNLKLRKHKNDLESAKWFEDMITDDKNINRLTERFNKVKDSDSGDRTKLKNLKRVIEHMPSSAKWRQPLLDHINKFEEREIRFDMIPHLFEKIESALK